MSFSDHLLSVCESAVRLPVRLYVNVLIFISFPRTSPFPREIITILPKYIEFFFSRITFHSNLTQSIIGWRGLNFLQIRQIFNSQKGEKGFLFFLNHTCSYRFIKAFSKCLFIGTVSQTGTGERCGPWASCCIITLNAWFLLLRKCVPCVLIHVTVFFFFAIRWYFFFIIHIIWYDMIKFWVPRNRLVAIWTLISKLRSEVLQIILKDSASFISRESYSM